MNKLETLQLRKELGFPHWEPSQNQRLQVCVDQGATIAYWNSDNFGMPANHEVGFDSYPEMRAYPGLIQEVSGPLELCGKHALHATFQPHKWKGSRVWIVALWGEVKRDDDKVGSLTREILGEILPCEALDYSVACRLGRKDLDGANLEVADLSRANLEGAHLFRAHLEGAHLEGANLDVANLSGANLEGANLEGANLEGTNLEGANLEVADLSRANLYVANLFEANLYKANLDGTNLGDYVRSTNGYAKKK